MVRFLWAVALNTLVGFASYADVLDLLRAGLVARNRGNFDAAISYYTQAIDAGVLPDAQLAVVLNSRGVAYDTKGEPDKAIGDFDAAIRLKRDFGEAYINRGLAWVNKRDYDHAIADFTEATAYNPKGAFLAYSNRGGAYMEKGVYDKAIADYGQAIELQPDYADAYYGRARTFNAMNEYDKAMADYSLAIRINPEFAEAYNNRGVLHIARGELDQGIADFDSAIRLDSSDPAEYANRGYAYEAKGAYDHAIADFNEAIRRAPYNAPFYLNRGIAHLYSGRPEDAARDFMSGAKLHGFDVYVALWLHRARVRGGRNDHEEFTRNASNIDRMRWPGPLLDVYLGTGDRDAVRSAPLPSGDAKALLQRKCEIDFYLALFDLERMAVDEARQGLRAAVESCAAGGIEHLAAETELSQIGSGQ